MAGDLIREVRRAALIGMKADTGVTALIPAASLYPSTTPANPAWPFGRFDAPSSIPITMSCVEGATVSFIYHAFCKDRTQGGAVVETAEDYASRAGSAMKQALHNRRLPVAGTTARFAVRSVRVIRDADEQSAYHAILNVTARVLAA